MKKLILIFSLCICILGLTACENQQQEDVLHLPSHFRECSLCVRGCSTNRTYNLFDERRMVGKEIIFSSTRRTQCTHR